MKNEYGLPKNIVNPEQRAWTFGYAENGTVKQIIHEIGCYDNGSMIFHTDSRWSGKLHDGLFNAT